MVNIFRLLKDISSRITNILEQVGTSVMNILKNIAGMTGLARQLSIVAAVFGMIVTNLLISGSEDSNSMYNTFYTSFSPAPYAFAIWGPIFLGLIAFAIYQVLPSMREDSCQDALAWPFIIACLGTALTPFVGIGVSNILIAIILIALVFAFKIVAHANPLESNFFWLVRVPITMFFGWISVATILNFFQWFSSLGISFFGPGGETASALFIGLSGLIGIYLMIKYGELVYSIVLTWAFLAIAVAHADSMLIIVSTLITVSAIILTILWKFLPKRPRMVINRRSNAQ